MVVGDKGPAGSGRNGPLLGKQAEAVSPGQRLVLGAPEQAMLGLAALQLGLSWGLFYWAEFEGALGLLYWAQNEQDRGQLWVKKKRPYGP